MVGSGYHAWPWEEDKGRAGEKEHACDGELQGAACKYVIYPNSPFF